MRNFEHGSRARGTYEKAMAQAQGMLARRLQAYLGEAKPGKAKDFVAGIVAKKEIGTVMSQWEGIAIADAQGVIVPVQVETDTDLLDLMYLSETSMGEPDVARIMENSRQND